MEIVLVILLAITAVLAAWNIRLSAQARRERGGLRQSLETLETRMGEISGSLTGNAQAGAESKAIQSEREKSDAQHRKEILAAQDKAVESGRDIQEALKRLNESLRETLSAQIQSVQGSWMETADSLRSGISENRDGLMESMAQGRDAAAKAVEKSLENHVSRMEASLEIILQRFEKRVAEYLEENALRVKENLLEAMDRFPEDPTATQVLSRSDAGRETHGG